MHTASKEAPTGWGIQTMPKRTGREKSNITNLGPNKMKGNEKGHIFEKQRANTPFILLESVCSKSSNLKR